MISQKKSRRKTYFLFLIQTFFLITFSFNLNSCSKTETIESLKETELFTLNYGSFEEELSTTDLNSIGNIRIGISMRDGFFYIVDGDAKKVMELNSYGDLLTLFYNEESYTKKLIENSQRPASSIHREINYPFDYPGIIAVDSQKCIYTVCTIPFNRQEQNEEDGLLYSQTVLRFSRDGSTVDYIGQQGPGGTPFPLVRNIYITQKDELVVVSNSNEGFIVYWFSKDGFLKYMIPISVASVPMPQNTDSNSQSYATIENVIPDMNSYEVYVKIDYYSTYIDEDSRVQSGINYDETLLYTLDESGVYKDPLSIPPYEESVTADYSRLTYKIPYDFLGVTQNGWKFFVIKTDNGFNVEMLQSDSQHILRRHFEVNHNNNLFHTMSLSNDGIITALYLEKENARVIWYRTDNLIDALVNN